MAALVVDQGSHAHLTVSMCRVRLERLELRAVLTYMDCTGAEKESFKKRQRRQWSITGRIEFDEAHCSEPIEIHQPMPRSTSTQWAGPGVRHRLLRRACATRWFLKLSERRKNMSRT